MLKICMVEVCEENDKGSIGAFYVKHHAELAGFPVDMLRNTKKGYDVELVSVHHCSDFERLSKLPKRAKWRIVGGHPMQNNPRPCIPFADAICVGEGETWIRKALTLLDETNDIKSLSVLPGTIITSLWKPENDVPKANFESPLPINPPYLNRPNTRSAAWYIEFARGCPFKCHYCELGHSVPYRAYDTEYLKTVIDQADTKITRKINPYAPDEASVPRYNELYEYLNTKGYNAGFASMRVDSILKNMPNLKKNQLVRVGIDGLTEKTRFRVNKKITDEQIIEYFKVMIEKGHVTFKMFMIIGYPWDTIEDFKQFETLMINIKNLRLAKNVSLRIKWTPFIPQPCTPLANAIPNYTFEMYQKIEMWHALNRRPKLEPGFFIENDGIMSLASHKKQCNLTNGNEDILGGDNYSNI